MIVGADFKGIWGYLGISILMFHLSFLGVLFLVPLQILALQKGWKPMLIATVLAMVAISAVKLILIAVSGHWGAWTVVEKLDFFFPLVLVAGLLVMNIWGKEQRALYRIAVASLVAGALALPAIIWLNNDPKTMADIKASFDALWKLVFDKSRQVEPGLIEEVSKDDFFNELVSMILSSFFFFLFLVFASTWRIARGVRRSKEHEPWKLERFRIPEQCIWLFLGFWTLLLGREVIVKFVPGFGYGDFLYVLTNGAYIMQFLFGLQGLGIIFYGLARLKAGLGIKLLILFSAGFLMVIPTVSTFLIFGISILGALELWIKFRKLS